MKKVLLMLIIFMMIIPGTLFAAKLSSKAQSEMALFEESASTMSSSEKMLFYTQNKKSVVSPLLLNIFVGCGVGSYVEGDVTGGTISLVGELGSVALYYGGYIVSASQGSKGSNVGLAMSGAGLIGLLSFRIYEIVRACTYTAEYNKQLQNALYSPLKVGFAPVIENNEMKLALAAKISL